MTFKVAITNPRGTSFEHESVALSKIDAEIVPVFADDEASYIAQVADADAIIAGAKQAFLDGDDWAYLAGLVAVLLGAALVFFLFPKKEDEEALLAAYQAEDSGATRQLPDAPLEPEPLGADA